MKENYLFLPEHVTDQATAIDDPDFKGLLIGGGKFRPDAMEVPATPNDLLAHAVEMTGKSKPKVLLIPSAKATPESHNDYNEIMRGIFEDDFDLEYDILHPHVLDHTDPGNPDKPVIHELMPGKEELEHKIGEAALIFVAGGNTGKMLNEIWMPNGIDTILKANVKDTVFAGSSAGAIVWGEAGHSDSFHYETAGEYGEEDGWVYAPIKGLGMVKNTVLIPHHDSKTTKASEPRDANAARMLEGLANESNKTVRAIGIDDNAAIEVVDGSWSPIRSERAEGRKAVQELEFKPAA